MWSLVTFEYLFLYFSTTKFDWWERNVFFNKCFGGEAPPPLRKRGLSIFAKRDKHHQALWLNLFMRGSGIHIFGTKYKLQGKRYCFGILNRCSDVFWRWFKNKNFLPVHQFFSLLLATKSCCPIMCVQDWISPFQEKDKDSIDQVSGLKVEIRNYPDSLGPKT